MRRRQALQRCSALLAVGSLSGCAGSDEPSTETDASPFETEPDALLLPRARLESLYDHGWVETDHGDPALVRDADASVQYGPDEADFDDSEAYQEAGRFASGVWLYDDRETAETEFAEHPYQDGWGYEERSVGEEAIGGATDDFSEGRVLFRDANALGGIEHRNRRADAGTKVERSLEVAEAMHDTWRGD